MKTIFLILTLTVAFAFSACSSGTGGMSPTEVFKNQTEAQKKKDVAAMKRNLSKGTLELVEKGAKIQNKTLDEALAEENPQSAGDAATLEFRNEKIDGDTATVEVKTGSEEQWATMPFVKEDGRWKIAIDKYMQDLRKQSSPAGN